jgi:hypothetical protein
MRRKRRRRSNREQSNKFKIIEEFFFQLGRFIGESSLDDRSAQVFPYSIFTSDDVGFNPSTQPHAQQDANTPD